MFHEDSRVVSLHEGLLTTDPPAICGGHTADVVEDGCLPAGRLDPGHVRPRGTVPAFGQGQGLGVLNLRDDGPNRPAVPRIGAGRVQEKLRGLRVLGPAVDNAPAGVCTLGRRHCEAGQHSDDPYDDA